MSNLHFIQSATNQSFEIILQLRDFSDIFDINHCKSECEFLDKHRFNF